MYVSSQLDELVVKNTTTPSASRIAGWEVNVGPWVNIRFSDVRWFLADAFRSQPLGTVPTTPGVHAPGPFSRASKLRWKCDQYCTHREKSCRQKQDIIAFHDSLADKVNHLK